MAKEKMVSVLMSGGLGNQMFQYAFYLSLKHRSIECSIDTSMFENIRMHNGFELSRVFGIDNPEPKHSFIHRKWIQFIRRYKPSMLVNCDTIYKYDENVYKSSKKYLIGDWISVRYFDSIIDDIRKTYNFKGIHKYNLEKARCMHESNSVSLHIRRGDYLNLPNYCVCDEKYYLDAIELIKTKVEKPTFFVFSNDPVWSAKFVSGLGVDYHIVNCNQGQDSYQDMYLMTQCKHNIIANSTFSWWGAWLNHNKDKIVVAPNKWFRNNNNNANCPGWELINVER